MALRVAAAITGLLTMAILVTGCGGGDDDGNSPRIAVATIDPRGGGPSVRTVPSTVEVPELEGFIFPIADACLPQGDQLMPNAQREYRQGVHEGLDFYEVDNCTPVTLGTPVIAAKEGTIVRIDHDYIDLTAEMLAEVEADLTSDESLDSFRGQQVWIDHGAGVVTRYCHLSDVNADLQEGDRVRAGQVVGLVGESGTPESVRAPGTQYHLHFEVRVGDSFLGARLDPAEVRDLYNKLFSASE